MAQKPITLTRDVLNHSEHLHPDHDPVEVGDGDEVVWIFPDLPNDQFGFVFFDPRLGPFHSLRSASNQEVLGRGNVGSQNDYTYTAMILQLGSTNPIATGTGKLHNRATKVNTTPEVFVTYHQNPPPGSNIPNHLEVRPFELPLNPGDTATWYFLNLPEDAFPDFRFDIGTSTTLKESTGPFVDFYACGGGGVVTVRGNGTGFVTEIEEKDRLPQYHYYLEVRDKDGKLLGSHDPLIDTIGIPPTL